MKSSGFHAMLLGALLLFCCPSAALKAQDGNKAATESPRLGGLDVAFEWQYSCPNGRGCSFSCPGSGGATSVTKLSLYLGAIALSGTEQAAGVFYEFSTMQIPRANGFALTTGISTLSCQVQGMNLDYSGARDVTASVRASSR
jgi:hypothetical protein